MSRELIEPIFLSIEVALAATALGLPLSVALALLVARKRFPGRLILDSVLNLPLVLPPLVTGYFLLVILGAHGIVGRYLDAWFGWRVAFTTTAAVIAAFTVSFPLFYRAVKISVESMDERLEDVAATLGATRWDILRTVTLPLNARGIVAGAVTAFARSLGEFGATIVFAANIPGETRTIPLAVFTFISNPGGESHAAPLIAVATIISIGAMAASYLLLPVRRREP